MNNMNFPIGISCFITSSTASVRLKRSATLGTMVSACKNIYFALAIASSLMLCRPALGLDRIRTTKSNVSGTIKSLSRNTVSITSGSAKRNIQTYQITYIIFDKEPTEVTRAKRDVRSGRFEAAAKALEAFVPTPNLPPEILSDVQFQRAYCAVQLALAGEADSQKSADEMANFLSKYPQSFHYFEAQRLAGELAMATGNWDLAKQSFTQLATAPWDVVRLEAAVRNAQILQAQEKYSQALKVFQSALTMPGKEGQSQSLHQAATLGKAVCLSNAGNLDEAISLIEQIISQADSENTLLHAQAYNALGKCYHDSNRPKDALLAFLHVDVIYFNDPREHAKSLANLVQLWNQLDNPRRAEETRKILKTRYPKSRWVQGVN